jgi:hypothetical protein
MTINVTDVPTADIKRGPDSWTFIYIALGFTISILGTIIQMVDAIRFPCNLLLYGVTAAGSFWLFTCNGWFQNKLIDLKGRYENRPR